MNLEAGGGSNREKRDADDQGECRHCRKTDDTIDTISYPNEATRPRSVVT